MIRLAYPNDGVQFVHGDLFGSFYCWGNLLLVLSESEKGRARREGGRGGISGWKVEKWYLYVEGTTSWERKGITCAQMAFKRFAISVCVREGGRNQEKRGEGGGRKEEWGERGEGGGRGKITINTLSRWYCNTHCAVVMTTATHLFVHLHVQPIGHLIVLCVCCVCTCVHVCVHMCACACVCACMCVCVCMYTRM